MGKRSSGIASWIENRPVYTQVVIPLVINASSAVLIMVFARLNAETLILAFLCLGLSALLTIGFVTNERLLGIIQLQSTPSEPSTPLEVQIQEVLRSMSRYGFVRSSDQITAATHHLRKAQYVRGEHLLGIIANKVQQCESSLWAINDHPFSPFSSLILQKTSESTSVRCLSAVPDSLYSLSSIQKRLELLRKPGVTYHLLPPADVHLSLVVFDSKSAIIYTTPTGHEVCNYSEALFAVDAGLVSLLCELYEHVEGIAVEREAVVGQNAEEILNQHIETYSGEKVTDLPSTKSHAAGVQVLSV